MSKDNKLKKLPYLPLWVAEYVEGTMPMTCQELGAYQRLLNHSWTHGGIKNNDWDICFIIREKPEVWESIKDVVLDKFYEKGGLLYNEKLEGQRIKSENFSKAQSARVKKRWDKAKKDTAVDAVVDTVVDTVAYTGIDTEKHTNLNPKPYTLNLKTKNLFLSEESLKPLEGKFSKKNLGIFSRFDFVENLKPDDFSNIIKNYPKAWADEKWIAEMVVRTYGERNCKNMIMTYSKNYEKYNDSKPSQGGDYWNGAEIQ